MLVAHELRHVVLGRKWTSNSKFSENLIRGPKLTRNRTPNCEEYLRASQQEGSAETREYHVATSGWYSSEVIALAVTSTSLRCSGIVEYVMSLDPLHLKPARLHGVVGAVVNVGGRHWVALRSVNGQVMRLDGQASAPRHLTFADYKSFVSKHASFLIEYAKDMSS